jgi:hypothetical protein
VRAVVNCRVYELARALELLVVMSFKSPINRITNPNLVSSHLTRDNMHLYRTAWPGMLYAHFKTDCIFMFLPVVEFVSVNITSRSLFWNALGVF